MKKLLLGQKSTFRDGFLSGLGWALGVTVGFVFISTVLVYLFNLLGDLPFIGHFFANIVESTLEQLQRRSVL